MGLICESHMSVPHAVHFGWKIRLGMIANLGIGVTLWRRFTDHHQCRLNAILGKTSEHAGDARIVVQARRSLEDDGVRQESFNAHGLI